MSKKILASYFSASGATAKSAKQLAEKEADVSPLENEFKPSVCTVV